MTDSDPTFDAFRLARKGEALRGEATMGQLPRLAQSVLDPGDRVRYEIQGRIDADGHPGATMRLSGRLTLRCERCNEPMTFELDRDVPFRFVQDEQALNALPIEDEELEAVVGSPAMRQLLTQLRSRVSVILVDSPPLTAGVDPYILGTVTGNMVLVLRTGRTDRSLAEAKLDMLDRLPVRVLGAVLNGVQDKANVYRHYSYLPHYEVEAETGPVPQLEAHADA